MAENPKIVAQAEFQMKNADQAISQGEKLLKKVNEINEKKGEAEQKPIKLVEESDIDAVRRLRAELSNVNNEIGRIKDSGKVISESRYEKWKKELDRGMTLNSVSDDEWDRRATEVMRYEKMREAQATQGRMKRQLTTLESTTQLPEDVMDTRLGNIENLLNAGMSRFGMGGLAGLSRMAAPVAAGLIPLFGGKYVWDRLRNDAEKVAYYQQTAAEIAQRAGYRAGDRLDWEREFIEPLNADNRTLYALGISPRKIQESRKMLATQDLTGITDDILYYAGATGRARTASNVVQTMMQLERQYAGDPRNATKQMFNISGTMGNRYEEVERQMMGLMQSYVGRTGVMPGEEWVSNMGGIYANLGQAGTQGIYHGTQMLNQMAQAGQQGGAQEGFLLRAYMSLPGTDKSLLSFEKWKEKAGPSYYEAVMAQAEQEAGSEYAGYYLKKGGFISSIEQYDKLGRFLTSSGVDVPDRSMMTEISELTGMDFAPAYNVQQMTKEWKDLTESMTDTGLSAQKLATQFEGLDKIFGEFGINSMLERRDEELSGKAVGLSDVSKWQEMNKSRTIQKIFWSKTPTLVEAEPWENEYQRLMAESSQEMRQFLKAGSNESQNMPGLAFRQAYMDTINELKKRTGPGKEITTTKEFQEQLTINLSDEVKELFKISKLRDNPEFVPSGLDQ